MKRDAQWGCSAELFHEIELAFDQKIQELEKIRRQHTLFMQKLHNTAFIPNICNDGGEIDRKIADRNKSA